MSPSVSAARIATIGPHPIITFRDYILRFLRKSLSRAVQVIRQPTTTFHSSGNIPAEASFSAQAVGKNLVCATRRKQIHHLIGRNTLCERIRAGSIWRSLKLRAIDSV
ncbi:hypothetical protein MPLB_630064 [Mesorhizobium sp. ORS 3324]|nr:hypothetical protein MPLB_630064 [Mesorhizobium sp. ORS 3324]